IVLYGHRRMGKTSILLNIANLLGPKVKLAYINLLRIGSNPQGVGEVLIAITDAIAKEVNLEPPADRDLLHLPYRNFERYLNRVISNLDGSLIVALDEFEKIEELIANGKIPSDFMGFLRGMVQMSPKLAFALAGLHTLDEMTEDYFHPFFASIIPIRVGFLTPGATRQILANPGDEDFLLDYENDALDRIYQLTHGQPYLVQLVGFLLVRRYNELTFETGRPQKPIFTKEDVEAVIQNPNFYGHGRYYFTGVWDQAAQGAKGQQQILTALAPHPKGLTLAALGDATGIDTPEMQTALETLDRHDVVKENHNRWQIAVELLRRWVANR
ncbi:MAG: ATP-binding protein, partial [Cyanobacteriota bacterium]|nr:ATP-binding protein [Cyanobacteriota bacterium]